MESKYEYVKVDPYSEEDIKMYYEMVNKLNRYLGKKGSVYTKDQVKWQRIRMGAVELLDCWDNEEYKNNLKNNPDEYAFFVKIDEEIVGFVEVCTYHVVNGTRPNDNTGIISEIFVDTSHRGGNVAYNLLHVSLKTLIDHKLKSVILSVQEDNPNRFLHFAMADKILKKEKVERLDGSKTISYDLLISDINKIYEMSAFDLGKRAARIKRDIQKNNLSVDKVIKK